MNDISLLVAPENSVECSVVSKRFFVTVYNDINTCAVWGSHIIICLAPSMTLVLLFDCSPQVDDLVATFEISSYPGGTGIVAVRRLIVLRHLRLNRRSIFNLQASTIPYQDFVSTVTLCEVSCIIGC